MGQLIRGSCGSPSTILGTNVTMDRGAVFVDAGHLLAQGSKELSGTKLTRSESNLTNRRSERATRLCGGRVVPAAQAVWLSRCPSRRPSRLSIRSNLPAGVHPKSTEGYWPCRAARSSMTWISSRRAPCAVRSSQRRRSAWRRPRQTDGRTVVSGGMLGSVALRAFADTCIAP